MIVEYGKKLVDEELTTGTGGNLSIYVPEDKVMLISPSGINYYDTKLEDVVVMDLAGHIKEGKRKPSSEYAMHSVFYKNKPGVLSVIHAHADFATAMSCLRKNVPPIHYAIANMTKELKCTNYKIYGSPEIAKEAYRVMGDDNGILLANHGLLATGGSIEAALANAVNIEFLCKLYVYASAVGKPVALTEAEMDAVTKKFQNYGQPKEEK